MHQHDESDMNAPDWLAIAKDSKGPDFIVPPTDTPNTPDKPEMPVAQPDKPHCWHAQGDINFQVMKVGKVCCGCGLRYICDLEFRPEPGHGYFSPSKHLADANTPPPGPCAPPAFVQDRENY